MNRPDVFTLCPEFKGGQPRRSEERISPDEKQIEQVVRVTIAR